MRLIYHPDAEAELIESARFYEQRVPSLGGQFLNAVELATGAIRSIGAIVSRSRSQQRREISLLLYLAKRKPP
jgi:hypothetical protein